LKSLGISAPQAPNNKGIKKTKAWHYIALFAAVLIVMSVLYLRFAWNRYEKNASKEAVMLAQSLESLLHPEHIAELTGTTDDLDDSDYIMSKKSMVNLVKTTNPIHFAYLLQERNGSIIILMDSEEPDSQDYSPPGQIYEEADESYFVPFTTGNTVLTDPVTDRWGTWISVLVPVRDPSTDTIIAVLGIDYSEVEWYAKIRYQMIPDVFIVLSILLLFAAFLRTRFQKQQLKELSRKLAYDETIYRSVFEQAPVGIAIMSDKNFVVESEFGHSNINPMMEQILGRTSNELQNIQWTEITHPDDVEQDLKYFNELKNGTNLRYSMEKRYIKPDSSIVWTNMKVSKLQDLPTSGFFHVMLVEDITKRKSTEDSLEESERNKALLLSNLPGLAYRCNYDREGTMKYVSDGCFDLTGYSPESFLNNRDLAFNDIIAPEFREALWKEWERTIPHKIPYKCEYEIITATGELKWVLEIGEGVYNDKEEVVALEGIILDITDRKGFENKLKFFSEHDQWTGLYNRRYLINALIDESKSDSSQKRALISINLTPMQELSLRYGFNYSQELLKELAESLKNYISDKRQLFSTYEYRFVFYVKGYKDRDELTKFCEVLEKEMSPTLAAERINGGIGVIEINDKNRRDIEQLLKDLLIASEKAISSDEEFHISFFDEKMAEEVSRADTIGIELSQIAETNSPDRLYLLYQPILDTLTNRICGYEALARLNSEKLGIISPLEFIPIAEKTKLIIPLGYEIITQALLFLKKLDDNGYGYLSVSINISAIQLTKKDFAKKLMSLVDEIQVNPNNVSLELTESVFASNFDEINSILLKLRIRGIKISIDDFGTGYSSLAREREIHANSLKIDKWFIHKLMTSEPDKTLVSDIISMGHKLGHSVIAEGVEYVKQFEYLKDHGCDKIQGYLISRPLDEEAAIEILNQQK
jgi:PAS domain S-box-containing protein